MVEHDVIEVSDIIGASNARLISQVKMDEAALFMNEMEITNVKLTGMVK